jgi:hypothetical protein
MKKKVKDLKKPQVTETFAIKTPTKEMVPIAKRLTFYTNSGEEDFSFITLNHSWVEMLPLSTKIIPLSNLYPPHGIKTVKDLLVARFIGELNLRLPEIDSNLQTVREGIEDIRQIIKSFKLER